MRRPGAFVIWSSTQATGSAVSGWRLFRALLRAIDWVGGPLEVAITRDAVKNSPAMDSLEVPSPEPCRRSS